MHVYVMFLVAVNMKTKEHQGNFYRLESKYPKTEEELDEITIRKFEADLDRILEITSDVDYFIVTESLENLNAMKGV